MNGKGIPDQPPAASGRERRWPGNRVSMIPLGIGQVVPIEQMNPLLGQFRAQTRFESNPPAGRAWAARRCGSRQASGRGEAVEGVGDDARGDLPLEAADPLHEILVEIGSENSQETNPLQQRRARVERFVQHPAVEFQPAEIAAEKFLRGVGRQRRRMRRVRGGGGAASRRLPGPCKHSPGGGVVASFLPSSTVAGVDAARRFTIAAINRGRAAIPAAL